MSDDPYDDLVALLVHFAETGEWLARFDQDSAVMLLMINGLRERAEEELANLDWQWGLKDDDGNIAAVGSEEEARSRSGVCHPHTLVKRVPEWQEEIW